jgi:DnaJ-class molecular chaperone
MDKRRYLEILELESVISPEALKRAYRDMVQIWHPDRFHGKSRLEKMASAKLKDINRTIQPFQDL